MNKVACSSLVFSFLLGATSVVKAQFDVTLENEQPRPLVTRAALDADSAHYSDKPATCRDKQNNVVHWVWTEFDKYGSRSGRDSSYIVYARAENGSKSWSNARRISKFNGNCANGDSTLKHDAPIAGLNGEVFVCWASPRGVAFQRSLDTGTTWMPEEKIIAPIVNGWKQVVDGIPVNSNPKMVMDETGPYKGRIYITWSGERNGVENKDVFLVFSDDKGTNWSKVILVTYRPNHKDQFNPNISVQPGTGKVFLSFFDKQNYVDEKTSDLYLGVSSNGGEKFYFYKVNTEPIVLDSGIANVRGLAFQPGSEDAKMVWSQLNRKNILGIHSVMLTPLAFNTYAERYRASQMILPESVLFADKIIVPFELKSDAEVTAVITKADDPSYSKIAVNKIGFSAGPNTLELDTKVLEMKKDNYVVTLYYNGRNNYVWILK